ncbi:hypothetical protein SmJEL517_g04009 [Synchytrium microbalum]|uniref:Anaphase-promoting complex subunit 4 WD40 domain-containing protein n=1 Tax=Synchytrium microbalum TaxID=1806994 RepID=A0A507C0T4_9FUNG|nr:uncharacterized protein SmJEL517_g04009 [Synchytrium microbalum]TPX33021.1 hypothetical protein SmJEL517_g04009 [Synchytrium microbalum]
MDQLPLTDLMLGRFGVGKAFKNNTKRITSIDFDFTGELCITASEDDTMNLYDVRKGELKKTIFSKKYGCDLARFTHAPNTVLHSSTKEDDTIRYLSLHDNQYLRYFRGHKAKVISLDICPVDDRFISSSLDGTVRLWDMRSSTCHGCVYLSNKLQGPIIVAYDPTGVICAFGLSGSRVILLYDSSNVSGGPFSTFTIQPAEHPRTYNWTSLKFSACGSYILICTNGPEMGLVDAFTGKVWGWASGYENTDGLKLEGGFTNNNKYIYCGSQDGKIHFWSVPTLQKVETLEGHSEPTQCVVFNPRHLLVASADSQLAFWCPKRFDI